MRRFIIVLIGLIFACSISVPVLAAPDDSNLVVIQQEINEYYGINVSDLFMNQISQAGFNTTDNYFLWLRKSSSYLQAYVYSNADYNSATNQLNCTTPGTQINYQLSNGSSYTNSASNWNVSIDNQTDQIIGYYNSVILPEYMQDYLIPNFQGGVSTRVNETVSSPNVPLYLRYQKISNTDITDYTQYIVEVRARFAMPTIFDIGRVNRQTTYEYSGYVWSDWSNIYTYEDNKHLSTYTYNSYKLDLPDAVSTWTTLFNDNIEDLTFNFNYNDTQLNKTAIVTQLTAFNLPMAGIDPNKFDIYVRFCKLDEGVIKYGRWTHYTNGNIEVVSNPPQNIPEIPINLPSGSSVLDNNQVDNQINNNVSDPYIVPDININNNVNYPDQNTLNYPTIASYNKDQLLLDTLDMAQHMPTWFESCVAAFELCFSLIHPAIWTIIGFGFMLSIVVMVLKVL